MTLSNSEWGSVVEVETKNRILVSLYAYAYEEYNISLVSDYEYDKLSFKIDLTVETTRPDLDKFFIDKFDRSTAMWVGEHTELDKLNALFHKVTEGEYL